MITTTLMNVTPQMARGFLADDKRNRPLNRRRAASLTKAIQRGEWKVNGDTIRISKDGGVLDGQHRLTAIADSGIAVMTLFVFGLDQDVFDTIDVGGVPRTTADVLAISGEKHYTVLASASRITYLLERCGDPFNATTEIAPTVAQIEDFIESNPGIRSSASFVANTKWVRKNIQPSTAAMCHFIFSKADNGKTQAFFDQLDSGAGLSADSPVLLLRERLADARGGIETLAKTYKAALMFKAFRHFVAGASLRALRIRLDGPSPEKNLFLL